MKGHPANCIHSSPINFGGRFLDGTTPLSQEGQEVSNFFGQSSFGSYAIAKEGNVVKVDKDVDIALLGPLGCGIQTGSGTVLNRLRLPAPLGPKKATSWPAWIFRLPAAGDPRQPTAAALARR